MPNILPVVPVDPYMQLPYRYRLSAGEHLQWRSQSAVEETTGEWEHDPPLGGGDGAAAPGMPDGGPAAPGMPPAEGGGAIAEQDNLPHVRMPGPFSRRKIHAGAGIVWSAGADGIDDGGWTQEFNAFGTSYMQLQGRMSGMDLIFVVPKIERKK